MKSLFIFAAFVVGVSSANAAHAQTYEVSLTASDLQPCSTQFAQLKSDVIQHYNYQIEWDKRENGGINVQHHQETIRDLQSKSGTQLFMEGWSDDGMGFGMQEVYNQNTVENLESAIDEINGMVGNDLRNSLYTESTWIGFQRCIVNVVKAIGTGKGGANGLAQAGPLGLRDMPANGMPPAGNPEYSYFTGGVVTTNGFICDAAYCNSHWLAVVLHAQDAYGSRQSNVLVNGPVITFSFNQPIAGGTGLNATIIRQDTEDHYNCYITRTVPEVPYEDSARDVNRPARVVEIGCDMTAEGRAAVKEAHRFKAERDAQLTN